MERQANGSYHFGGFRLDPASGELFRDGRPVPLEARPTRLLIRLVERPGQLVTRRELRELGWPRLPGAAEQSLNTCIRQIRQALEDDASAPAFVETLRGRGYRFIAPVSHTPAPAVLTGARLTGTDLVVPTNPVSGAPDPVPLRRFGPRARQLATAAVVAVAGIALASVITALRSGARGAPSPAASRIVRVEPELAVDHASLSLPDEVRRFVLKAQHLARTHADPALGVALLDSALAHAPELAPALGLKAELLLRLDEPAQARSAALAGLRLDPADAGALRALAGVQMLDGAWTEAEASLTGALSAHPDDPTTLTALAFLLTVQGRFDEAQEALAHAERGDPLTPLLLADAGLLHLWAGRFDRAAAACRETLQLDPQAVWALGCAFDALVRAERHPEAAEVGRSLLATYGVEDVPAPSVDPATVLARVRQWRVSAWEDAVRDGDPPFYLAVAYADAGRTAEALRALEEAARQPSLAVLSAAVEPRLRALADDMVFRSVLRRLKLSGSPARS